MEELTVYKRTVEIAPLEDVAKFMLIAPEKAKAQAAEIRAMRNLGMAQEVLAQKEEEQRMLNELILDAGARIGELTKAIPKAPTGGNRGNQYTGGICDSGDTKAKTKEQIGAELGFTRHDMSRFEKLADNKDLIEEEKALARKENRQPTRTNVLERAKEREKTLGQEEEVEIAANISEEKRAAIKEELNSTDKSHKKIAKEYGVDPRTVDRISNKMKLEDGFVDGAELSARALNKRIDEDYQKMVNQEKHEYTVEDAEDEFGIIMDEFISKLRRVIQVRKEVVKGSKILRQLIIQFSIELKNLKEEI